MDLRALIAVVGVAAAIVSCAPSRARSPADPTGYGGCPPVPDSLPQSTVRRSLGSRDLTSSPQTGALFVEVKANQLNRSASGAHVSLRNRAISRDTVVMDSVVNISLLPEGRYSLLVKRLGFRLLRDSISIRSGYLDTIRVALATDIICLANILRTEQ